MTNWSAFPSTGARATIWNYNQYRGWLDSKSYPDSTGPAYSYTSAGRSASRNWARGTNTTYSYNNAGENSGQSYNDGSTPNISNILDRRSRQATNVQGSIVTGRTFDDQGNLLSETYSGGPLDGLSVTNGFDQFLRRTNLSLLNSSSPKLTNSAAYDSASRLQTVSDGQGNSATYAYLANSPLIDHIDYTSGGSLRMTRSNQFDNLNRLTNLVWRAGPTTIASFAYQYNDANQRTRSTLADGSYWLFGYDSLGQVTSGRKYWSDGTPVAGEQFEYGFDDIGNRTVTRTGGDRFGYNLRPATYGANLLNQYTNRTVPGYLNVLGAANPNATVSLWTSDSYWAQATRHLDFFRGELAVISSTGALWLTVTNLAVLPNGSSADIVTNTTGNSFVPQTPEQFGYDSDGNLTNDGRFSITWDAENRPTSFTSLSTTPAASRIKIDCTYDSQWRRTQKVVSTWNGSNYIPQSTNHLVYDGWNLIATLDHTNGILYSFTWGLDLSGSQQGAGGIGGLISMRVHAGPLAGTYFYVFDGNGNVMTLVNAMDGSIVTQYEYGPFGELLRATGPLSSINPFRFSTKSQDDETGLAYYGYRYYSPSSGRWISRDPAEEGGGVNLNAFLGNNPASELDPLGLWKNVEGGNTDQQNLVIQAEKDGLQSAKLSASVIPDKLGTTSKFQDRYRALFSVTGKGRTSSYVPAEDYIQWYTGMIRGLTEIMSTINANSTIAVVDLSPTCGQTPADTVAHTRYKSGKICFCAAFFPWARDSRSNRSTTVLHEYSHMVLDTVDHLDVSGPREPDANYWAKLPKWAYHWGMLGAPKGLDTEFGRVIQIEQSFGYIDPPKK